LTKGLAVTNTPQFDQPNANFNSTNFGQITNTIGGNRAVELGAKITF